MNKLQIYEDFLNIVDESTQKALIKEDPYEIRYIKNPSEEVQLIAVKGYGQAIEDIKDPSEIVQLEAVKKYSFAINYIKNPSELVQLESIKEDIYLIEYIKNPSELVQLEVVKNYNIDDEDFFMEIMFLKIQSSLALNLLYKKVLNINHKKKIASNSNYKTDAKLILDKINK